MRDVLIVRSRVVACQFISAAIIIDAPLHMLRISRSTNTYLDSLAFDVGTFHITALHLAQGFIIFVVVFWMAGVLSRTMEDYLHRNTALSHNTRVS